MNSELKILPLGGLGQIGMNMMVLECGEDALLIDCGVMFPDNRFLGVDLVLPDFKYVLDIQDKIKALLLTHAHEDHIGAVPYLLKHLEVPIYGSAFTLALLRHKLTEFQDIRRPRLSVVVPNQHFSFGKFSVEFLEVNHSTLDAMGLAIRTPLGTIIHTGDFKIDETIFHGKKMTLEKFKDYGKKGVFLLMSDSTNVEREGKALQETQIAETLQKICKSIKGKIVFSVFATNIHRIQTMFEIALQLKRKIVLTGRTMETNVGIAFQEGFLPRKLRKCFVEIQHLDHYRDPEIMILCTGSQAEEFSALSRIAMDEHRFVRLQKGDAVILSSRFIPGNEKAISDLLNQCCRLGAEVYYDAVAPVHVSGHAHASELRKMIQTVKPHYFLPIHGEYRHLVHHAKLAATQEIPKKNIFICENGDQIIFKKKNKTAWDIQLNAIDLEAIYVENENPQTLSSDVLRQRKKLSELGVVMVTLVRHAKDRTILEGPLFQTAGLIPERFHQRYFEELEHFVSKHLKPFEKSSRETLQEELRLGVRRFFKQKLGKKTIVFSTVIDAQL